MTDLQVQRQVAPSRDYSHGPRALVVSGAVRPARLANVQAKRRVGKQRTLMRRFVGSSHNWMLGTVFQHYFGSILRRLPTVRVYCYIRPPNRIVKTHSDSKPESRNPIRQNQKRDNQAWCWMNQRTKQAPATPKAEPEKARRSNNGTTGTSNHVTGRCARVWVVF